MCCPWSGLDPNDRIVMRPLEIFPLVMDVLVVTRLLLLVPIGDFLFLCHWFFERGAFPSGSASGPSWMSVDILVGVVGDIARIQVNVFGFVILRVLCRGRKIFRVPLFDGRFLARVLTGRSFPRESCSIEWGGEVEPLPADFGGSAGTDSLGPCRIHELILFFRPFLIGGEHLFELLERCGVGLRVGCGYVRYWSVEIGAAASIKRSLHVIRVRQTVGTEIHTVDFRLNKETKKTLVSQRTRISVNYHTSSNQNTRITTIKIRNRKESKVDLILNLRMSVTTRYNPGLESCRRDSYPLLCSSPRTPYILAPRSVYAFTLLPLSRHSIKWRFSIFPVLHNYLQNFHIYPRKLDIYPSSWAKRWASNRVLGPFRPFSDPTRLLRNSGKHGLSLLRSSGDSIRRFDENAWTGVVSMLGKVQSLHSDRTLAQARSLCSDRALLSSVATQRPSGTSAWLLRSDRAGRALGRYVATERDDRLVADDRTACVYVVTGRRVYVATELGLFGLNPKGYFFVKTSYRLFLRKLHLFFY
ncbi:hypothetical protein IGI04_020124 [Brassica rapa subsp. trilocularis]|uniref:Uncharacterized protein n=1 Tax=Brassica rapa subsp. trilocularis TaxID=1813537 RepID=A0ABQ7MHT8_BRACM|nr:hypothetical protein IGI04_020124 [Brassica rapa subsp. trilocularis]